MAKNGHPWDSNYREEFDLDEEIELHSPDAEVLPEVTIDVNSPEYWESYNEVLTIEEECRRRGWDD